MRRPDSALFGPEEQMRLIVLRIRVNRDGPDVSEWCVKTGTSYLRIAHDPRVGPPSYGPKRTG